MKNQKLQEAEEYWLEWIKGKKTTDITFKEMTMQFAADFALQHSGEQPEEFECPNGPDCPACGPKEQPEGEVEKCESLQALIQGRELTIYQRGDAKQELDRLLEIAAQKQAWLKERRELVEAAEQLVHLHMCEMEGMQSGQPAKKDWLNAVYNLSEILNSINTK